MEWNGEIMRKKFFSSFVVFALVLSLTLGSATKAYAMGGGFGEIILGTGAVIAVEEAVAYTLLAVGLTAGADAVYRNQAELKAWANNRVEDIKKFGNDAIEFGSDVVAGLDDWFTGVANGVMDTGSKCWDMVKGWAGTVYDSAQSFAPSHSFAGNPAYSDGYPPAWSTWGTKVFTCDNKYGGQTEIFAINSADVLVGCNGKEVILSSLANYQYIVNETKADGSVVIRSLTLSSGNVYTSYTGDKVYYTAIPISLASGVSLDKIGHYDWLDIQQTLAGLGAGDITTVGGLNDALEKGGMSMDDYNLVGKSGAVAGANTLGLEWQQLMEKDKIKVDDVTGVATGSIAGSLADVAAGTMSWANALDKVGVVPVLGDNVIDDAGVTDKPRPSTPDKPSVDGNYIFDLRNIFPFCLPFDMVDFLGCLCAPPETPKFTIEIPSLDSDMSVKWHKLELDFSQFNQVAVWVRNMELLAFIVGLAMITRSKMIRG